LRKWLAEVLAHVNSDSGSGLSSPLSLTAASDAFTSWWGSDGFDPETFAGSSQVKKVNCLVLLFAPFAQYSVSWLTGLGYRRFSWLRWLKRLD
jgi:hypothetical protein